METLTREDSKVRLRRSREVYDSKLRSLVDTPENLGKIIIFDIETADYEIGDDPAFEETAILQARHPGAVLMSFRIGYRTGEIYGLHIALPVGCDCSCEKTLTNQAGKTAWFVQISMSCSMDFAAYY